ncbi:hypothetical protein E4U27_004325 [Claviceps purpurea]|nr:hypothetical protein E4U27_004325 [Claviceps purpurea]
MIRSMRGSADLALYTSSDFARLEQGPAAGQTHVEEIFFKKRRKEKKKHRAMSRPGGFGVDLAELASSILRNGPRKVYPALRRIRVIFNRTIIVDSAKSVYVWEHDSYPQFYFPTSELKNCYCRDLQMIKSEGVSRAALVELNIRPRPGIKASKTDRVIRFTDDKSLGAIVGLVRLEFGSMDQWLEEDTPIYVHPKDPFKRVDTLLSSRSFEIKLLGKTVAKVDSSIHLHETGRPVRYYISPAAVDPKLLRKSALVTSCPYKGDAEYYDIILDGLEHKNLVWYYRHPVRESAAIAGLLCFEHEKMELFLDGKPEEGKRSIYG